MIPYFVVLILSIFFYYGYVNTRYKIFIVPTIAVLVFLVGMRDLTVGTDTEGYIRSFMSMGEYHSLEESVQSFSTENGWIAMNWLLYRLHPHYWFLFTFAGLCCIGCALYAIEKESQAKLLSLFIYITLGFYLFGFAAMRQSLALSVFFVAFIFLQKRSFIKYAITVLIGSLFHQTLLVALPLYFVFNIKFSKKYLTLIAIGSLFVGMYLNQLLSYSATIEERYAVYMEYKGGGEMLALFYTIITLFFLSQRHTIMSHRLQFYDTCLNMLTSGTMIYLIVVFSGVYSEVTRLAMYFQIAVVFLWGELYASRRQRKNFSFWIVVCIAHVAYFYLYLNNIGAIVPYVLNSELN